MDNLNLIFLGVGFFILLFSLILLIVNLVKQNGKISGVLIAVLLIGFISIGAGIFLMMPGTQEDAINEPKEPEEPKEDEVLSSTEEELVETSTTEEVATETSESEPLKIARELVEQEMSKQVGLASWEITKHVITSDQYVHNIADYDKPVGDMRKVWIEGYVRGTAADDGTTGEVGYNLELYQMKGDSKWYIGTHWGVLAHLEVTDVPVVDEDERYLSHSDEIIFDEVNGGLSSSNVPEYGETYEQANPTTEADLIGGWHWIDTAEIYMILRKDQTFSYIEEYGDFVSEGTYTVNRTGDSYNVNLNYSTGQKNSVMTIQFITKNHFEGNEKGYRWEAKRVNSEEVEEILTYARSR